MSDRPDSSNNGVTENNADKCSMTLVAKWGKERITLQNLTPDTTLGQVKKLITERTNILPKRQKLIGLSLKSGPMKDADDVPISDLKVKSSKRKNADTSSSSLDEASGSMSVRLEFILMGTPEEHIFVDPTDKDDLPDVIDDFDLDFNAGSTKWINHVANEGNLRKFTESTAIHIMNQPRPSKPLLVLDLDHTLLDFSNRQQIQNNNTFSCMKRPYMDQFLTTVYRHYDLVVWSHTSWRWLETKLTELEMLSNPGYKFSFVLDKTSMFAIKSTKRDGSHVSHHVKPLQIIWTKFPHWGRHNTVHLDDLSRNFALNLRNGIKCSGYYRKKSMAKKDCELLGLATYLERLSLEVDNFEPVDFSSWMDVVSKKKSFTTDHDDDEKGKS